MNGRIRGAVLPDYHLVQRKRSNGRVVLYAAVLKSERSAKTHRPKYQMLQLQTAACDLAKSREKTRRDKEAHAELLELYAAGKIGVSSDLDNYLLTFWDYEKSEYIKDRLSSGHSVSPV